MSINLKSEDPSKEITLSSPSDTSNSDSENFEVRLVNGNSSEVGNGQIYIKEKPLDEKSVVTGHKSVQNKENQEIIDAFIGQSYEIVPIRNDDFLGSGSFGKVLKVKINVANHVIDAARKAMWSSEPKDLEREIYMNLKLCQTIFKEANSFNKNPIEYARECHVPLCISCIIDEIQNCDSLSSYGLQNLTNKIISKTNQNSSEEGGKFCFTLIPGKPLDQTLEGYDRKDVTQDNAPLNVSIKKLPPLTRAKIFKDLCLATTTLDRAGIVHNDVKQDNILVDVKNEDTADIYLLDFGMSIDVNDPLHFCNGWDNFLDHKWHAPELEKANLNKNFDEDYSMASAALSPDNGPKCNAYQIGAMLLPIFFGKEGESTNCKYCLWFLDYLRQKEDYYRDIEKNVKECNKKCGNPYTEEECAIIINLAQNLLNMDPENRTTCANIIPMLDQLMSKIEERKNK